MNFPALVRREGGVLHSFATGVPDNGVNEFDSGLDLERLTKLLPNLDDWIRVRVYALGLNVTGASFVARVGNNLRVNFQQAGADQCYVTCEVVHSTVR